jgi:ABC-type Na+ efflux pump permease subunit
MSPAGRPEGSERRAHPREGGPLRTPVLIAGKEGAELLASPRGVAWLLVLAIVLSGLALLLVGNTELSLLDNAQAVYMEMGAITALGALLAVATGADAVAGERERGTLVPLLLAPCRRRDLVLGKIGGIAAAWAATYALALPYLWAVGSTGQNLPAAVGYLALLGTPVVVGFGLFALGLSARLASVKSALLTGLVTLVLLASPVLLGPGLRQSAVGRGFDAVNPFSAALNTFDSVVIDSQPFAVQAARLAVVLGWLALAAWFAARGVRRLAP